MTAAASVRRVAGIVEADPATTGGVRVNVAGAYPAALWPAGYIPTPGDAVSLVIIDNTASILGPVVTTPRVSRGTVAAAASGGAVLVRTDAGNVTAEYAGTAPAVGDAVFLDWQRTTPRILSTAAPANAPSATTPPPTGPSAPGAAATTGRAFLTAIDSATWTTRYGNWSSTYGRAVIGGAWSGSNLLGSWFYGAAPTQHRGKTVTAAWIRYGARRRMGNYNAAITTALMVHGNPTRPGGAPAVSASGHPIVLGPNAPADWHPIPAGWVQAVINSGGGFGFSGGDYGGVNGVDADPESGQIRFDWKA